VSAQPRLTLAVTVEHAAKKTFASAAEWPGWSRGGKTEELALEALVAYASRYGPVARAAGLEFPATVRLDDLDVIERTEGSSGTEFGVPSKPTAQDGRPLSVEEAERLASLVEAAWSTFDRIAAAAPDELRKGPRGSGRNTSKVIAHVMDADRAYANEMGIKIRQFAPGDRGPVAAMRASMLNVLRAARDGTPLGGRHWPARYAAHRVAWHALDHAWEVEDRTEPAG
jgi:hypothetical protein